MTVVETNPAAQRALAHPQQSGPGAKRRILETADRLFYEDGIRSVGIDRLIAESSVTKATFYKHYGSKDRLIAEYLKGRHQQAVDAFDALRRAQSDPADLFSQFIREISADVQRPGFRGCAFINAAAEFSDPRHDVRVAVSAHRDWYTDVLVDLLRDAGYEMPGDAADEIILARDGAMTGGYAGDPIAAASALHRAVDRVLRDAGSQERPSGG